MKKQIRQQMTPTYGNFVLDAFTIIVKALFNVCLTKFTKQTEYYFPHKDNFYLRRIVVLNLLGR